MTWAQEQRLKVMNDLKKVFVEAGQRGDTISHEKLIAELMMTLGCTRRKACEYVQDLVYSKFITREGDVLQIAQGQL